MRIFRQRIGYGMPIRCYTAPSRPLKRQLRHNYGTVAVKKKGLQRCKPLKTWRARQDLNPLPLGS